MCTREADWRLLECRFEQTFAKCLEKNSQSSLHWKRVLQKDMCGLGETDKDSNDYQTKLCTARSSDEKWQSRSESRKAGLEKREAEAPHCSENERKLLYRSKWRRVQRNSPECEEKIGKTYGSNRAVQKTIEHHDSGCKAGSCIREESQINV